MRSSVGDLLGLTSFWLVLLVAAFVGFDATTIQPPPPPLLTNETLPIATPLVNTTLASQACALACAGGDCAQSPTTGIVSACQTCGSVDLTPVGATCFNASRCTSQPWCSAQDAAALLRRHNALVGLALYNQTLPLVVPLATIYPLGYANWTQVGLAPPDALSLLNSYLAGRVQTSVSPVLWFDDEDGWWHGNQLDAYLGSVPVPYADYLPRLKRLGCIRTWIASINGTCTAP